jgi:hypothetical protein
MAEESCECLELLCCIALRFAGESSQIAAVALLQESMLHSEVPHLFSGIESPVVLFDEIELDPPLLFGVILPEL